MLHGVTQGRVQPTNPNQTSWKQNSHGTVLPTLCSSSEWQKRSSAPEPSLSHGINIPARVWTPTTSWLQQDQGESNLAWFIQEDQCMKYEGLILPMAIRENPVTFISHCEYATIATLPLTEKAWGSAVPGINATCVVHSATNSGI